MISEFENVRYYRVQSLAGKYKEDESVYDESKSVSNLNENDKSNGLPSVSLSTLESAFAEETEMLCFRLHTNNFYMNKSITTMIGKYEKNLEDVLKVFLEPLVDKFAELRDTENDYAQILSENVKIIANNLDSADECVSSLDYFGGDR